MKNDIDFSKENQVRGNATFGLLEEMESDKTYNEIGLNKGLFFSFRKEEVIHFPEAKKCYIICKPYGGKPVLYIPGFSENRKRMVDIPLAIFRRIPAVDEEVDAVFSSEHPITTELAELSTDLQRAKRLCELGSVQCGEIVLGHKAHLEKVNGEWKRIEDKLDKQKFFIVEKYEETV